MFDCIPVREADNLDRATWLRISMGISYCLEHMHQLNPHVVPRNFDSSTIYLMTLLQRSQTLISGVTLPPRDPITVQPLTMSSQFQT
jgi:hypothetical protein